jgi:diaminopimelate decarboxylase
MLAGGTQMTVLYTTENNFFKSYSPEKLLEQYGSPLYVYNEDIFRKKCREMRNLIKYDNFKVTYSIKANSNLHLLKIAHEEGLNADAMSPGEIYVLEKAGFRSDEIFFISNNVSAEEMLFAINRGIMTSVDSLSQMELYGKLNRGGKVAVRVNPGVGAGHHEKVVTGGKNTKFGINIEYLEEADKLVRKYELKLAGLNQHIGSLFLKPDSYVEAAANLLSVAERYPELEFVDFGGGFGIPYHKQEGEERLELDETGRRLEALLEQWIKRTGRHIMFKTEPGRYIPAESGIILGRVHSVKTNGQTKYAGTDIGFNVLIRPAMYGSHHDIEVYRDGMPLISEEKEPVTVVGNICESGDILAKDRMLPEIKENDIIAILDAGAYGYSMSSNYNNRLRPAEILICSDGSSRIIRKRDTLEDLVRNF